MGCQCSSEEKKTIQTIHYTNKNNNLQINQNNIISLTKVNKISLSKKSKSVDHIKQRKTQKKEETLIEEDEKSISSKDSQIKTFKIKKFTKKEREKNIKVKNIKSNKIFFLLQLYIEAKTGLYNHSTEKEAKLIAKGLSQKNLNNKIIDTINYNIRKIKKIYKNQKIPNENIQFTDDLFPPNIKSILGIDNNNEPIDKIRPRLLKSKKEFLYDTDNIIWLRAKDIFPQGKYSLFVDDISIDDVRQGSLGNCYFMSSLAAMTSIPQLIIQIFKSIYIPKNNCYEIGMNIEGEWKIVLLDDYFPCSKKTKIPIFAKPNGPELWVMLLEKAWAKINGGYINISGGFASEVLSVLTSFPIQTIKLNCNDMDLIWEKLLNDFKKGQIISSCSNFNHEIEKYGLISGHSFTVINFTSGYINGELIRLIRLRNPWGYKEWNGDWSDHSNLWTYQSKKILNANLIVEDDGAFWMSFNDFFKYFCIVDVCKVINPQCVKSFKISNDNVGQPNIFHLEIYSKTKLIFNVIKKYYRFHRTMESYQELAINLIIMKINFNCSDCKYTLSLIDSTCNNEDNPYLETELTIGYYIVYIYCNYKYSTFKKRRKINLYISSDKYFNLVYKGIDNEFNLLKQLICDIYNEKIKNITHRNKDFISYSANKFDKTIFGFLVMKNLSDEEMRLNVNHNSQNFHLVYPFDEDTSMIETYLPSGKTCVFLGIRQNYYELYNFSLNIINHKTPNNVPILSIIKSSLNLDSSYKIKNQRNILLRASFIKEGVTYNYYVDPKTNMKYLESDYDDEINENYDFIFKKLDIDKSKIAEKIDYKSNAEKYFLEKYPKEMKMILSNVPPLNDNEEVIFRDIFDYRDTYYIGEWKVKEELIRHGRGLLVFSNGTSYLGQFINNYQNGKARFYVNQFETIDINFKNGVMDGMGILKKADGSCRQVFYERGEKIREVKL